MARAHQTDHLRTARSLKAALKSFQMRGRAALTFSPRERAVGEEVRLGEELVMGSSSGSGVLAREVSVPVFLSFCLPVFLSFCLPVFLSSCNSHLWK